MSVIPEFPYFRIKIDTQERVELSSVASCMASLDNQYYRFIKQGNALSKDDSTLYVKEISQGSIIIDLCVNAPQLLVAISPVLVEYFEFLCNAFNYLVGKNEHLPPFNYRKEDFVNFKKMFEVAVQKGNSIHFSLFNSGNIINNHSYSHVEANAAQNQCNKEIKRIEKSGDNLVKEKVELRLYQARNSNLSKVGNMGIIDEISDKPKVLSFLNDRIQYDITKAEDNPFNFTYTVDIEAKLKEGSLFMNTHKDIKEYEILKLHGVVYNQDLFDDPTHQ